MKREMAENEKKAVMILLKGIGEDMVRQYGVDEARRRIKAAFASAGFNPNEFDVPPS